MNQPCRPAFRALLASIPDLDLREAFARNERGDPWVAAMLRALGAAPMNNTVRFTVHGETIPQGSAKGFAHPSTGRVIVTHDNPRTKPWRVEVGAAAREAVGNRGLLAGAVAVDILVTRTRPKSHYGVRGLRQAAPRWPTTRPDIDKLERAILDALTNVIYRDDAQVVELHTNLCYVDDATLAPETIVTATSLEGEWT